MIPITDHFIDAFYKLYPDPKEYEELRNTKHFDFDFLFTYSDVPIVLYQIQYNARHGGGEEAWLFKDNQLVKEYNGESNDLMDTILIESGLIIGEIEGVQLDQTLKSILSIFFTRRPDDFISSHGFLNEEDFLLYMNPPLLDREKIIPIVTSFLEAKKTKVSVLKSVYAERLRSIGIKASKTNHIMDYMFDEFLYESELRLHIKKSKQKIVFGLICIIPLIISLVQWMLPELLFRSTTIYYFMYGYHFATGIMVLGVVMGIGGIINFHRNNDKLKIWKASREDKWKSWC